MYSNNNDKYSNDLDGQDIEIELKKSPWREFSSNMYIVHPFIYIITMLITVFFIFVTIYFSIEIITRNDLSLVQKSLWELLVLMMPIAGNLSYAFFSGRD